MEREFSKIEIRDIRDSDWYWISRVILEDFAPRIGAIGLALYNVYASYARDKGTAFPSQKTIGKKLRVSLKTIRKYNKILEKIGLIKVESGRKEGKSNVITLLRVKGEKQLPTGYESSSHLGREEFPTKENNIKENTNVDDKESSVREVFDYFRSKVREVKGFEPEIDWGKDGKMIKRKLGKKL